MKFLSIRSVLLGSLCAVFSTAAVATDVEMNISVDNSFEVSISDDAALPGAVIGSGSGWSPTNNFVQALVPGEINYIHVFAANTGTPSDANPGAFLGQFDLSDTGFEFANGTQTLLTCAVADCGWLVGAAPPAASIPEFLYDHADAASPWAGDTPITGISPDADWIWLDAIGDAQTPVVVFTAAILPVFDVEITVVDAPDPVTAGSGDDNLTHTFTVTNLGTDVTGVQTTITDTVIPVGTVLTGASVSIGALTENVWDIGDMAAGASETLTITLTVGQGTADGETVSATMNLTAMDQVDSNPDNNTNVVDPTTVTNSLTQAAFTVTKTFSDDLVTDVDVAISCNDGFVNASTATISSDGIDSFRFVVSNFVNGSLDCTISEETQTEGYATSECVYEGWTIGEWTCELTNDAEPGEFSVTKTWDITGGGQSEINQDVILVIDCESEISNPMPLPCSSQPDATQCVWDLDWDGLGLGDSVTASVDVDTETGDAYCTAYEVGIDASEVESSDDCDPRMLVEAGGSNGCEITNTVFFEGIPTLSQYGLALMALLMLGMGMVGFRRFA
ncbi:DUF11 domain-containing protein [Pseudomonadota bacterium]